MPRPREAPKTRKFIFIPNELLLEIELLYPEQRDAAGHPKYGAFTSYVVALIRKDLEEREAIIKGEKNGV